MQVTDILERDGLIDLFAIKETAEIAETLCKHHKNRSEIGREHYYLFISITDSNFLMSLVLMKARKIVKSLATFSLGRNYLTNHGYNILMLFIYVICKI